MSCTIDFATFADYSLSEINTGAKWVNGQAIYKKTVNFGALPNATVKSVAHGITNLQEVIEIEGIAKRTANTFWAPLPLVFYAGAQNYNTALEVDSTNLSLRNDADRSGFTAYITIYYTKSS